MSDTQPYIDEVDLLLDNARLRDELEPYIDDSVDSASGMPLSVENEYLASMLAWERAPAMPIANWFQPPLQLPHPDSLKDRALSELLNQTIKSLHGVQVILECTEHLSDRQLYTIIYRDIMPRCEKKVDLPENYLHWRCLDEEDETTWLKYYASAVERRQWQERYSMEPPKSENPPYPRQLPR